MNAGQRRIVALGCAVIAVLMHAYIGDWTESETGFYGQAFSYDYGPGDSLSGFRWFAGNPSRERSLVYTDHRNLAAFFLGIILPLAILTFGAAVLFGPDRNIAEARATKDK